MMKIRKYTLAIFASFLLVNEGCTALRGIVSEMPWATAGPEPVRENTADTLSTFNDHPKHSSMITGGKAEDTTVEIDKAIDVAKDVLLPERNTISPIQERLLKIAKSKLGNKYKYASQGPETFDCSGLMSYVFKQEGINLPHGSAAQYSCGRSLKKDEPLKAGDLVFFSGRRISSNDVGHVGMVVDYDRNTREFTFIHAAMTGVEIQKSTAEYYALRYIGARRILADD